MDGEYKALQTGYCGSCRRNYVFMIDLQTQEEVSTYPIYIKITALIDLDDDSIFVMQED